MKHRGKLLATAIAKSQQKKTVIAKLLGCSTRYIYDLVEKEEIPNDDMLKYGKALGYDFTIDLPELAEYQILKEPEAVYNKAENYREKYFQLMEKHIQLIDELEKLKENKEPVKYKSPAKKKK